MKEVLVFFSSLLASKIAVGTILLGISCEYVNNNRKESTGSTLSVREQVSNTTTTTNDPPVVETTTATTVTQPLEKAHTRSMSLVHLNELVNQKRLSESPTLAPIDGGDELNETSFRDADDNYQCLINDQNCPPTPNFSKASTPGFANLDNAANTNNSTTLTTITNKDEGIVFTAQTSSSSTTTTAAATGTNKKSDLDNVERYKMCGNSHHYLNTSLGACFSVIYSSAQLFVNLIKIVFVFCVKLQMFGYQLQR